MPLEQADAHSVTGSRAPKRHKNSGGPLFVLYYDLRVTARPHSQKNLAYFFTPVLLEGNEGLP